MIKTFENFNKHIDIDPYGEEDWNDDIILKKVKILPNLEYYIKNIGLGKEFKNFINKITTIKDKYVYKNIDGYIVDPDFDPNREPTTSGYFIPKDCIEFID